MKIDIKTFRGKLHMFRKQITKTYGFSADLIAASVALNTTITDNISLKSLPPMRVPILAALDAFLYLNGVVVTID